MKTAEAVRRRLDESTGAHVCVSTGGLAKKDGEQKQKKTWCDAGMDRCVAASQSCVFRPDVTFRAIHLKCELRPEYGRDLFLQRALVFLSFCLSGMAKVKSAGCLLFRRLRFWNRLINRPCKTWIPETFLHSTASQPTGTGRVYPRCSARSKPSSGWITNR